MDKATMIVNMCHAWAI